MNRRLRQFERMSGLEIYALGKDREKWERGFSRYDGCNIHETR